MVFSHPIIGHLLGVVLRYLGEGWDIQRTENVTACKFIYTNNILPCTPIIVPTRI
jgi:hypothetical protein